MEKNHKTSSNNSNTNNSKLPFIYYFPIGLLMGIADSMPGFSGSTVSLLFKQYEIIMNRLSKVLSKQFFLDILYSIQHRSFVFMHEKYNLGLITIQFTGIVNVLIVSFIEI